MPAGLVVKRTHQPTPVMMPESVEHPLIELLGMMKEGGATFANEPHILALLNNWLERHYDSPVDHQQAFNLREATAKLGMPNGRSYAASSRAACVLLGIRIEDKQLQDTEGTGHKIENYTGPRFPNPP